MAGSNPEHGLRDLARKMIDFCRQHPNYSQARPILRNAEEHLCALAALYERDAELSALRGADAQAQVRETQQ